MALFAKHTVVYLMFALTRARPKAPDIETDRTLGVECSANVKHTVALIN
jgi:hypothetical protein